MAEPKTPDPKTKAPEKPDDKPPTHLTVLILRDERVGKQDYKPGDTPKLTYAEAQRLIARGGADGDSGAVRIAQAQRKQALKA